MTDTPPAILTEHADGTFTLVEPDGTTTALEAEAGRAHPETGPLEDCAALGWHPAGRPTGRHGHRSWSMTREPAT